MSESLFEENRDRVKIIDIFPGQSVPGVVGQLTFTDRRKQTCAVR